MTATKQRTTEGTHVTQTSRRVSRRAALRTGALALAGYGAGCLGGQAQQTGQQSTTSPPEDRPVDTSDMRLVFEDTFESGTLDEQKWWTKYPWDSRTHNHMGYAARDNVYISEGTLVLEAENEPRRDKPYTTGVVSAKEVFQPGYVEGVIKTPPTKVGFWPAFWLTSASYWPPEIDIFEFFGDDPSAYMTYYYWGPDDEAERVRGTYDGADFDSEFHQYAVDWTEDRIVWYIDGEERFRYGGQYTSGEYMYLILNFGIGAEFIGRPNPESLPATYEIERVSAWRY